MSVERKRERKIERRAKVSVNIRLDQSLNQQLPWEYDHIDCNNYDKQTIDGNIFKAQESESLNTLVAALIVATDQERSKTIITSSVDF